MPHSHHSHSGQFCRHAQGTLEDVVREAIRQGFEVFGLTEHVPRYRAEDLYPEEQDTTPDALASQFASFLDEAHRLKEKYKNEITLLVGLETEHISPLDLDELDGLLTRERTRIQYVVGSVHHVNGIPIDFDKPTFERALASYASTDAFLAAYFDAQLAVLERAKPEVVAHFDLCRLYVPELRFAEYPQAVERLRRNVRFAVGYGAVFELNAAALRKGWTDAYPGEDVVRIIQELGGRFVLSDDSHGPHAVGLNYARLREYARRVGVDEIWVLEEASEPNAAGRFVRARRIEGNWWEHPFWNGK